jgi:hypothetical protein
MHWAIRVVACLAAGVLPRGVCLSQVEQSKPPADRGREHFVELLRQADQLDPARRLGMRSAVLTSLHATIPDVVIVDDVESYLDAIRLWRPNAFFPILIDDGTDEAREDIGRFVRSFKPRRVVRHDEDARISGPGIDRRRTIESALARTWNMGDDTFTQAAILEIWLSLDIRPAGLIIADDADPAWPAALALASGRAQPIAWVDVPGQAGGTMTTSEAEQLLARIRAECAATGLTFDALGDDIDAITLCQAVPDKIKDDAGDLLATSDVVTRDPINRNQRWAWCGHVYGTSSRAVYMAMCALFLEVDSAWIFDAYGSEGLFGNWDGTRAATEFTEAGLEARVIDEPNATLMAWRVEAARPIEADVICVNTQGMRWFFELRPGRALPGDVPVLGVPAMVHFVHSWSANGIANRSTVAGRWLERGAYAFAGSVQEPYLQAFVPTPMLAARLTHGYPWGAAVRVDSPAWRILAIGDPMMVPLRMRRLDVPLPLEGEDVAEQMSLATRDQSFDEAIALLVMLGRDEDAARLADAIERERPGVLGQAGYVAAIPAAFRAARFDTLVELFTSLREPASQELRDYLWLTALPRLGASTDDRLLTLLEANIREDQPGADAAAIAPAYARLTTAQTAIRMLDRVKEQATNKRDRDAIDEAINALQGR